jgi:hypothetical protein
MQKSPSKSFLDGDYIFAVRVKANNLLNIYAALHEVFNHVFLDHQLAHYFE